MISRIVITCLMTSSLIARAASGGQQDPRLPELTLREAAAPVVDTAGFRTLEVTPPARGAVLPALYATLAGLHAFDAYSTSNGLSRGARESNPLMQGVAGNSVALWTVKAGAAATSIAISERLWRHHRRGRAIAVMVAANTILAAVAAHNVSVVR